MSKILLISSDIKLNTILRVILKINNNSIEVAGNIGKAMHLLEKNKYNLILMDIHNHEINAFSFIKNLRDNGLFIPVLYMGERAYEEVLIRSTTGTNEYLLKPFTFSELKTKMSKLLIDIDLTSSSLIFKDKAILLGSLELKILSVMTRKIGAVITGDKLKDLIEEEEGKLNMTIFYYISSLRKKLEEVTENSLSIYLEKDGYRLDILRPV